MTTSSASAVASSPSSRAAALAYASPAQLRPVPGFNSTIQSDHLLAIGLVDDRRLILVDIEKLMSGADMSLVGQTLQ